jgi:surface protein
MAEPDPDIEQLTNANVPGTARHIVFTDAVAPSGVEVQDCSEKRDGSVVGWMETDTYYISTQRPGVKVVMPKNSEAFFANLKNVQTVDAKIADTKDVQDMSWMFFGCTSLVNVDGLATWDVHKCKTFSCMFFRCKSLQNVDGLAKWKFRKFRAIHAMFEDCESLENVDGLREWDVSRIKSLDSLFYGCSSLKNVDGLANWDVRQVTNMWSAFRNCSSLENMDGLMNWRYSWDCEESYMFDGCGMEPAWYCGC